jgi:hypothetical protein|tara:strand:- start:271 stop:516 length:246 start_codon:yes stop_codon:yes gene_type:complete
MFGLLKPYDGRNTKDKLVRCSCGRVLWLTSSSKVIMRHHEGHQFKVLETGTMWEFFKMKTGLIRNRTLSEWLRDLMDRRDS